jgi:hypothetical protein
MDRAPLARKRTHTLRRAGLLALTLVALAAVLAAFLEREGAVPTLSLPAEPEPAASSSRGAPAVSLPARPAQRETAPQPGPAGGDASTDAPAPPSFVYVKGRIVAPDGEPADSEILARAFPNRNPLSSQIVFETPSAGVSDVIAVPRLGAGIADDRWIGSAWIDAYDGEFALELSADFEGELRLVARDIVLDRLAFEVGDPEPVLRFDAPRFAAGTGTLVLTYGADFPETVSYTLSRVDVEDRISVGAGHVDWRYSANEEARFADLPVGAYAVSLRADASSTYLVAEGRVRGGVDSRVTFDGDATGKLVVDVAYADDAYVPTSAFLRLSRHRLPIEIVNPPEEIVGGLRYVFERVTAGSVWFEIDGAIERHEVAVGRTTHVTLAARRPREVEIWFEDATARARGGNFPRFAIRGRGDLLLRRGHLGPATFPAEAPSADARDPSFRAALLLVPGEYVVDVESESFGKVSSPFSVGTEAVRLVLPERRQP